MTGEEEEGAEGGCWGGHGWNGCLKVGRFGGLSGGRSEGGGLVGGRGGGGCESQVHGRLKRRVLAWRSCWKDARCD